MPFPEYGPEKLANIAAFEETASLLTIASGLSHGGTGVPSAAHVPPLLSGFSLARCIESATVWTKVKFVGTDCDVKFCPVTFDPLTATPDRAFGVKELPRSCG